MQDTLPKVLFLCTGNSSRSILAEAAMRGLGKGRFLAYSAGSHPAGQVNPFTLEALRDRGLPTDGLRSKSWEEFAGPSAPRLDYVFTLCDKVAGERCPVWPGGPVRAHWSVEDPGHAPDPEKKRQAFKSALVTIVRRIELFLALPHPGLDRAGLQAKLEGIGRS